MRQKYSRDKMIKQHGTKNHYSIRIQALYATVTVSACLQHDYASLMDEVLELYNRYRTKVISTMVKLINMTAGGQTW